jgi:hypothetical protein
MKKITSYALGATTVAMALLPAIAHAQGLGNFGLEYVTEIGLGTQDVRVTVARIIRIFMGLLGLVAVVIILLGGFKWMTAGGSEDKIQEAKGLITSGVIGLAIIVSAFAIASFVINSLITASSTGA